jgi:hypothetical protein
MRHAIQRLGAATLAAILGLTFAADAQTVRRHPRRPADTGRVIVVHPRESYLTAGPTAAVGTYNGYALDTLQVPGRYMPDIDHTTVGLRGQDRLPNNFTLPGCCAP